MSTPIDTSPAALAKGALRRLAQARQEPTPDNYARAYAAEAGQPVEAGLPAAARPMIERLVMRVVDDGALRGELVGQLMGGRYAEAQRSWERLKSRATAEGAEASAGSAGWADTLERLMSALERGGRQWTSARRKESLQRLLRSQRNAPLAGLQQQLDRLVAGWSTDVSDAAPESASAAAAGASAASAAAAAPAPDGPAPGGAGPGLPGGAAGLRASGSGPLPGAGSADTAARIEAAVASAMTSGSATPGVAGGPPAAAESGPPRAQDAAAAPIGHEGAVRASLAAAVQAGLPTDEARARELADELAVLADRIAAEGATVGLAEAVAEACQRIQRLFGLRHQMVDELMGLTRDLTEGMVDLAEEGSWARGQGQALRQRLDGVPSARTVRAARSLLTHTRSEQRQLAEERQQARDALKQMVREVLSELGALDAATGAFNDKVQGYAQVIESADSLQSLGRVVRELVSDSRAVHDVVSGARERLASEHARAAELEGRVRELESELRRLSDEVSTDALTQVANRRGLARMFELERQRADRDGHAAAPLTVGLLDIDNFKKLNDTLGHAAGDVALKSLAERVKGWLRPVDHIARFGGEEFVVLLPDTPVEEAQRALTRLQRKLSSSLFMHEGQEVFVTFSAGVSLYRPGEALEVALERADEALYEAKRTGKNRTCIA